MTMSWFIVISLYTFVFIATGIEAILKKDIWYFLKPFLTILLMTILIFAIYGLGLLLGFE